MSSFHRSSSFTSGISLGDTPGSLTDGGTVVGLLVEITFIAIFTQRFFAR